MECVILRLDVRFGSLQLLFFEVVRLQELGALTGEGYFVPSTQTTKALLEHRLGCVVMAQNGS